MNVQSPQKRKLIIIYSLDVKLELIDYGRKKYPLTFKKQFEGRYLFPVTVN